MKLPDGFKPINALTVPISERVTLMSTPADTTNFHLYASDANTGDRVCRYAMAATFWYLSKRN